MLEKADKALSELRENKTSDFLKMMNKLTFEIFTCILFGNDVDYLSNELYPFEKSDGTFDKITLCEIFIRLGKDYMIEHYHPLTSIFPPLNDYNLLGQWSRNGKNFTVFKNAVKKMIADSKDQNSVWAKMRELNEFTNDEIFYDLILLILGGSETSSHILTTIFYNLAKSPEVKNKLNEEFAESGLRDNTDLKSKIILDNIQNFDYLALVIKEALRMDPPVPTSFYYCAKEDITICDVDIQKGTIFRFEVVSPHFFEEHWLEPYTFVPERFDPESEFSKRSVKQGKISEVYSRRPFGHGARSCPGQTFGVLEVKALVSYLLPQMNYTVDQKILENEDVGFALGSHFIPQFTVE